jgi:hypothetical protein
MNPKIDIIVTRHDHLITVLRERGTIDGETPVTSHATAYDVAGKHVIGVLPHHLSARAASITEVPMRWSETDREDMQRGDVDIDRTRAAAGDPITYVVHQLRSGGIDLKRPRWLAMAKAWEHVEHLGYHFGAGPFMCFLQTFRGLPVTLVYDGSQQASAEVVESRGVWRPNCTGPWLDGYGIKVDPASIAPASGWDATSPEWEAIGSESSAWAGVPATSTKGGGL